MIKKIPKSFWNRDLENVKILDPVCGNGNFHSVIYNKLIKKNISPKNILENILYFNDIDLNRTMMINTIFEANTYNLNVTTEDYLEYNESQQFDLIVANPPYAKLLPNGKRASKNHNLIKPFLEKSLKLLKPNGYLLFITPDNWMSYADRNTLIEDNIIANIIFKYTYSQKIFQKDRV